MTKQEFVDAVAQKSGLQARGRRRPSTRCSKRSRKRSGGVISQLHRIREVRDVRAQGADGREPAQPEPEGAHPGRNGAEVHRRELAQADRPRRLAGEVLLQVTAEGRPSLCESRASAALGVLCADRSRSCGSRPPPSPTGSPRPSSRSAASSSSGSTRGSISCRSSCAATPTIGRPAAAEATARFCCGIIDAVAPYVVAVKPQLAFFEVLGGDGIAAFERVAAYARAAGLLVIVDGKRGDIGSTARAYADAYLEPAARPRAGRGRADREHVSRARLARAVRRRLPAWRRRDLLPRQDLERRQRRRPGPRRSRTAGRSGTRSRCSCSELGEELVGECGLSSVGAVVGATHPRAVGEARKLLPQSILLLPGRRRAGRDAGRHRPRVHERAGERARHRPRVGHVRLPGEGRRLASRRRRGGGAAPARGVGSLRLVDRDAVWARRRLAPAASAGKRASRAPASSCSR